MVVPALAKHAIYRELLRLKGMIDGLAPPSSDMLRLSPQIAELEAFYETLEDGDYAGYLARRDGSLPFHPWRES